MALYLSLTDFVDISAASGTSKAMKVRRIISRPGYNPATDFYKRLRDQIVNIHSRNLDKNQLETILQGLRDAKKQTAYPAMVAAYKKWWGNKQLGWFTPKSLLYSKFDVDVNVNPELGLRIKEVPYMIKLYFKKDALTKKKSDIITHMMAITLTSVAPTGSVMAVLDVRQGKLFSPTVPIDDLTAMVNAEMAYIGALWNEVG